ncbi:MAG: succinate dehydrogenase cytochrome b subunit [Crocinitomicaceae bacterium]|jgi:succinate dehydrogenase / fumarate reductase cytochrome b subunit
MSNSAFFKSSIGKKVFMALTGLFLCTFLIGHLLGNLQLILKTGEEGRRAFNEYAYFMGHNPFIKILSYVTYAAVLIHVIDGILLTIQNRKARPVRYAYSKPGANSSSASRSMAILGTLILVFLATHMANFWWKMKVKEDVPLHTYTLEMKNQMMGAANTELYYTHVPGVQPIPKDPNNIIEKGTDLYIKGTNVKVAEGYRDLHTLVMDFFSKSKNEGALFAVLFYVISMIVLAYHLLHGFQSAFQSLGFNHPKYTPLIKKLGAAFAILVPLLFAIIPVIIFMNH